MGVGISGLLVAAVIVSRGAFRADLRSRLIAQTAAVLQPVVQNQVDLAFAEAGQLPPRKRLASALVAGARQKGVLALAIFDEDGLPLEVIPAARGFVDLSVGDFLQLQRNAPISRLHLGEAGAGTDGPVLEVLLPVAEAGRLRPVGFVRFEFDARALAAELAAIDARVQRQTWATIGGALLVVLGVLAVSALLLRRASERIARGNASLAQARGELSLSAKAAALGPITSHLMHGLQGAVAGLQTAVGARGGAPDWQAAQRYSERVQVMVRETVELLNDRRTALAYELSSDELVSILRERNRPEAQDRGVELRIVGGFEGTLDNVRGNLVCLIVGNLVQNAVAVSAAGQAVVVAMRQVDWALWVEVVDQGPGVPEKLRLCLFEPGVSGRAGGSGLGLAIASLLAKQIDGALELVETGAGGSRFRLVVPLAKT